MRQISFKENMSRSGRLVLACLGLFLGMTGVLSAQTTQTDSLFFIQVSDTH
jgi:hypothetical protein